MKFDLEVNSFLPLTIGFILFTIVGTLSHEYGHIIVAEILGFDTDLHFASMNWSGKTASSKEQFLITLGGPVQTISTALIGFIILYRRRLNKTNQKLDFTDWILVFFSLFWLREVFNLIASIILGFLGYRDYFFGGDEAKLSEMLNLPVGLIPTLFGLIGFIFCIWTVFKIIPSKLRFTFIVSGLYGGLSGYGLWMQTIGPIILP